MNVSIAKQATDELVAALATLIPQLSAAAPPSLEALREIVSSPGNVLLVARIDGKIVGTLTLSLLRTPTAFRGWINDVVVDESARGRGAGEALTREALRIARERGVSNVSLTSRNQRAAAHELYKKIGFGTRDSTNFRYDLCK